MIHIPTHSTDLPTVCQKPCARYRGCVQHVARTSAHTSGTERAPLVRLPPQLSLRGAATARGPRHRSVPLRLALFFDGSSTDEIAHVRTATRHLAIRLGVAHRFVVAADEPTDVILAIDSRTRRTFTHRPLDVAVADEPDNVVSPGDSVLEEALLTSPTGSAGATRTRSRITCSMTLTSGRRLPASFPSASTGVATSGGTRTSSGATRRTCCSSRPTSATRRSDWRPPGGATKRRRDRIPQGKTGFSGRRRRLAADFALFRRTCP